MSCIIYKDLNIYPLSNIHVKQGKQNVFLMCKAYIFICNKLAIDCVCNLIFLFGNMQIVLLVFKNNLFKFNLDNLVKFNLDLHSNCYKCVFLSGNS